MESSVRIPAYELLLPAPGSYFNRQD
jgi:hypothetical protein